MLEGVRSRVVAPVALAGFFYGANRLGKNVSEKMADESGRDVLTAQFNEKLKEAYLTKFPEDANITDADLAHFWSIVQDTNQFTELEAADATVQAAQAGFYENLADAVENVGGAAAFVVALYAAVSTIGYGYGKIAGTR